MKNELKIEYIPITDVKPNEYNPKSMTASDEVGLEESIRRFGIVDPLIVNKAPERRGYIIGGHQRFSIYQKLGFKKVPVVWVNIPDVKKEKELCLRLSKNTGKWDNDLLKKFDEDLLKDVGFSGEEMDQVFGLEISDNFDEKKEFEKAVKQPRGVKTGDIWQLGDHKLLIGDCTKRENWEKLLGNERFDFMFTDPPYRIAYGKIHYRKVKTKNGAKLESRRMYKGTGETNAKGEVLGEGRGVPEYDEWLSIANDYQNPVGANVMVFEKWKNLPDLWAAIAKYWKIRNVVIWHLPNRHQGFAAKYKFFSRYDIAPLADKGKAVKNDAYEEELDDYLNKHGQKLLDTYEVILYGQRGNSAWERVKNGKWSDVADHITSPATSETTNQNVIFGTKPIKVLLPYLKTLSPRGGLVMEPFGGSGSTIIASEILNRRCRAIELVPQYGEVILDRFQKFTGIDPVKIN